MEEEIHKRINEVERRVDKLSEEVIALHRFVVSKEDSKNSLHCDKCSYTWNTKSKLDKVSCPSCGNKVSNVSVEDKEDYEKFNDNEKEIYRGLKSMGL